MTQPVVPIEKIFEDIGGFGSYQRWIYFMICLLSLTYSFQIGSAVYEFSVPNHRCTLPPIVWPNDTYETQSHNHRLLIRKFIPRGKTCQIYELDNSFDNETIPFVEEWNVTDKIIDCPNGVVFDQSQFTETYPTKNGLVCTQRWLIIWLTQSLLLGIIVGAVIGGWLSDKKGRKICISIGIFLQILAGLFNGLEGDYYIQLVTKFCIGISVAFTFSTGFVLSMELVSTRYRLHVGIIVEYVFAVGQIILALAASSLRKWNHLQLAISAPSIIFFFYYWILPESPRWLLSVGRVDEAYIILEKIANRNKRKLERHHHPRWWTQSSSTAASHDEIMIERMEPKLQGFYSTLLKSKDLMWRTINICFQWFSVVIMYYGIFFYITNLKKGIYWTALFLGIVEIFGYLITHLSLNRVGRVKPHLFFMSTGAIACLLVGSIMLINVLVDMDHIVFLLLIGIAKLSCAGSFALLYIWTAELFPTVHRTAGVGIASMVGRGGMLLAALLVQGLPYFTEKYSRPVVLLIMGGLGVLAAFLATRLPETLNCPLPQTTEDVIELDRHLRDEQVDIMTTI